MRVTMNSREDTKGVYARIVYDKGASILLMLDGWLGEDTVRSGLRVYLKGASLRQRDHSGSGIRAADAAGVDPSPVMDSFLNQTGIPVVHGEARCEGAAPKIEMRRPIQDISGMFRCA